MKRIASYYRKILTIRSLILALICFMLVLTNSPFGWSDKIIVSLVLFLVSLPVFTVVGLI
jgi:hypothetical protein